MLYILSTILTNKNKEDSAFGAANEEGRLEGIRVDRQKAVDIELGWQNHSLSPYFLPHQWQRMWIQVIVDIPMRPGPALRKNTHYCIEPKSQKSPGEWRSPKVQCLGQRHPQSVASKKQAYKESMRWKHHVRLRKGVRQEAAKAERTMLICLGQHYFVHCFAICLPVDWSWGLRQTTEIELWKTSVNHGSHRRTITQKHKKGIFRSL